MRTEALYFDADGNRIGEPTEAMATGEITYLDDDGQVTRRDYIVGPASAHYAATEFGALDRVLEEPSPFDLTFVDDGVEKPVTTLVELFTALGGAYIDEDALRNRVANLLILPFWENAPEDLRAAVDAYLRS